MTTTPTPPLPLLSWLVHEQSLTQKLQSVAGDARLEVCDQRWEIANAWDQRVLNLDASTVMHRDITMWAFDSSCWYARTILPDATYQANSTLFDQLKHEPLGHLIFNGTEITRSSLVHYSITPSSEEYTWLSASLHQDAPILWLRLSEFKVEGQHSFFLVEILLPGLVKCIS